MLYLNSIRQGKWTELAAWSLDNANLHKAEVVGGLPRDAKTIKMVLQKVSPLST